MSEPAARLLGLCGIGTVDLKPHPTLWGLDPAALCDRLLAAAGICVVRRGVDAGPLPPADEYLLCERHVLVTLPADALRAVRATRRSRGVLARVASTTRASYRERLECAPDGRFVGMRRDYIDEPPQDTRVLLTSDSAVAELWRNSAVPRSVWPPLRAALRRGRLARLRLSGNVADLRDASGLSRYMTELVRGATLVPTAGSAIRTVAPRVWVASSSRVDDTARLVGPLWIGSGRSIPPGATVAGPAILWDDPSATGAAAAEVRARFDLARPSRPVGRRSLALKRALDVILAIIALAITLPWYPFIMLAIWLEDRRPFFFVQERETIGGRRFGCIKFRSMRRDAEQRKAALASKNRSDGPQFHCPGDPRLTRVGSLIRKTCLDELPQFINVLLGDMSVVGPRPSPRSENQCCPAWRDARLSVRAGVTGLWQVQRTREEGMDFLEWIRYDIEYVHRRSMWLDLKIIARTILMIARRGLAAICP